MCMCAFLIYIVWIALKLPISFVAILQRKRTIHWSNQARTRLTSLFRAALIFPPCSLPATRFHSRRKYRNEQLQRHIQIFDDVAMDDMDQLASTYSVPSIDTASTEEIFTLLHSSVKETPSDPHLTSIIYHLLLVPGRVNMPL